MRLWPASGGVAGHSGAGRAVGVAGLGAFAAAGSAGALGWAQVVSLTASVTCTGHVTLCGMMMPAPSYDPTPAEADGGPPETDADRAHYDHND